MSGDNRLSRRFIPTGVGNSKEVKDWPQYGSVHPHGRGELRLAI